MKALGSFQHQQRQFLQYLRQPQATQPPAGFAAERLAVYADLLYHKFDESVSACFPVLKRILPQAQWRALLLDFIADHTCLTPYYRQIPDEFLHYLQFERACAGDWPFLAELAHFEWIELHLAIIEAEPVAFKALEPAQLLAGVPVFPPVLQLLHYCWPVQMLGPDFLPTAPPDGPTHILAFRDMDDAVQFINLNPMTAQLVSLLMNGLSGRHALYRLGAGLDDASLKSFLQFGLETIAELQQRGAIINVRPVTVSGEPL